jgi:hypothetical protein
MSRTAWVSRSLTHRLSVTGGVLLLAFAGALSAAPLDRTLSVSIALEGTQDWKNALQWSKATTTQSYDFSTTLRSDGKLYGANLLEPDTERRMAIKSEYLRQQGTLKLRAMGIDPKSPTLMQELSNKAQKASFDCKGDPVCMGNTGTRFAELMAAAVEPDNSHLFEGTPRYRFFFGYPGCSNTIRAVNRYDASGETAYGRNKDKISPYALRYEGDFAGSEQERTALCTFFTVVHDTVEDKLFVENTLIPESRGRITRTEFGRTSNSEGSLPIPAPLQGWVNQTLRHAPTSGQAQDTLALNLPLDGNSTVLGTFTGEARTRLKWSWTAAAPR